MKRATMKKISITLTTGLAFFALIINATAYAASLDDSILELQKEWAIANYQTDESKTEKAFEALTIKAEELVNSFPDKAEPLIWNAIIVSSDAGKNGGLSALGKVKKARELLLAAEKINPDALHGSIYTSLGSLYYQVPGWPLGFGDDEQAENYLKKALSMNPDGIDPNYFYGDFLIEQDQYDEARKYLNKALNAADRPARPIADKGRRAEIQAKLEKIKNK